MRRCCPICESKNLKSRNVRRTRGVNTPDGFVKMPYGPVIALYECACGWKGEWNELAKRRSKKSEKRAKQISRKAKPR